MESLYAAVANGADAVYLGFGDFNARRLAKNFSEKELFSAVDFAHKRGVRVYVTLNTLVSDREMRDAEETARIISRSGADAIITADLGAAKMMHEVIPDVPLHGSTQMSVYNLEGVRYLASLGFTRAVLARELSRAEISYICKNSPIELEVFVHGALCMCYSGQCLFSAVIGRRSGNRGLCAQPCRMQYKVGGQGSSYPLSLRDLCLADYICELSEMGVASLKIEGRMKRAEYVAAVTGIYSKILREGRCATESEKKILERVFSRDGFTDGYYTEKLGRGMFGIRAENIKAPDELFEKARKTYENVPERPRNVDFFCVIEKGRPAILAGCADNGERALAQGPVPETARSVAITEDAVAVQLKKTGGSGFSAGNVNVSVGQGLSLPLSAINAMRRECLDKLSPNKKERREGRFNVGFKLVNRKEKPETTVSVTKISQISDESLTRDIELLYIPAAEFTEENAPRLAEIMKSVRVCTALPRIVWKREEKELLKYIETAKKLGVTEASVGNIGLFKLAENAGFEIRADFGTNIYNSHSLREIRRAGAKSALLSPELTFPQIRDISKIIDTEIIAYGRLPLMIFENCVISAQVGSCVCGSSRFLTDRTGAQFPLVREFAHRNTLLNSQKIFLADKKKDYEKLGLASVRLAFTTENAGEVLSVIDVYSGKSDYMPASYTRGLYYRGVE